VTTIAGDLIWQGDQFTDTTLDFHSRVGGYAKYAARVMFGDVAGKWNIIVAGTNLADKRVLNQVTNSAFFPDTYYAQPAAGRQLFAMVSMKF
jgi:outer membrane receptor protein involved in Fe transport